MRRISRRQLETDIFVALSVLRSPQKRALGIDVERVRGEVTADLVGRIMGAPESETVILKPSLVGTVHSPRHGKWGESEPHPHPDLPFDDQPVAPRSEL